MEIVYYWIMGICLGLGIGTAIPDGWALALSVVGFCMAILSVGWYVSKAWKTMRGE